MVLGGFTVPGGRIRISKSIRMSREGIIALHNHSVVTQDQQCTPSSLSEVSLPIMQNNYMWRFLTCRAKYGRSADSDIGHRSGRLQETDSILVTSNFSIRSHRLTMLTLITNSNHLYFL